MRSSLLLRTRLSRDYRFVYGRKHRKTAGGVHGRVGAAAAAVCHSPRESVTTEQEHSIKSNII